MLKIESFSGGVKLTFILVYLLYQWFSTFFGSRHTHALDNNNNNNNNFGNHAKQVCF